MKKVTQAAYAKMRGISKQAIWKHKARGNIVIVDGLVDVEASDARMNAAKGARKPSAAPTAQAVPPVAAVIDGLLAAPGGLEEANLTRFIRDMALGKTATQADAATIKENALALKHSLEALRLNGSLVEIEIAEAEFFEEARSARDSWLNFAAKVGPKIAADLGLNPDRVVEVLTPLIHQQITDMGESVPDFTAKDT